MTRRTIILVLCSLVPLTFSPSTTANPEQNWNFKVFLNDRSIGFHNFRLVPLGENVRELKSSANFNVKFLFFTAYTYRHNDTEVWQGNCLQRIDAQTDDNGRQFIVRGNQDIDGFEIRNEDETQVAASQCVKTFAYWDPSILKERRLLNSQTGEFVDVRVEALGEETIKVRDQPVLANHYRLYSELGDIDLWYAADGRRWLALQSTTENGQKLSYQMY